MAEKKRGLISRRDFIKATGGGALAAGLGPSILIPGKACATEKTVRLLQWIHLIPAYDKWFGGELIPKWGNKYGFEFIVDNVSVAALGGQAAAEVSAQKGHDLFMFLNSPSAFEEQVIDHREIYEECQRKYGKPIDLAIKSTYNPRTKKHFGFSPFFTPGPVNYRKDLWDEVGRIPDTWDDVRVGGRKIKENRGNPVGIGLAQEIDTGIAMQTIMYSFGSSIQDEYGNVVLNSRQTLEAVKFVKALYEEAMTPEVFAWDASSNNRVMLGGKGSLTLNDISITRVAEKVNAEISGKIRLRKPPEGPVTRSAPQPVIHVYVIWKFAQNKEEAKQFLVDLVDNSESAFKASKFYNLPCFPKTVPDLDKLISYDSTVSPPDKYKILSDALDWTTNVGYPGYANAAIDEIVGTWVINTMFAKAAAGAATPEETLKAAETACKRIFAKWKEKRLV